MTILSALLPLTEVVSLGQSSGRATGNLIYLSIYRELVVLIVSCLTVGQKGGVSLTTHYSEIINGYFHVLPELKRIWFC